MTLRIGLTPFQGRDQQEALGAVQEWPAPWIIHASEGQRRQRDSDKKNASATHVYNDQPHTVYVCLTPQQELHRTA